MELQSWLPLLISRKDIIEDHIARLLFLRPEGRTDYIIVMDQTGKTFNRKPRKTDKEKILNGEIFLIYVPDVPNKIDEEEDAEISLDLMMDLLSEKEQAALNQIYILEKVDTFVQKTKIFEREFPKKYIEYEDRIAAFNSMPNFYELEQIPEIYQNMLRTAQKSRTIEEYLNISFSENK